MRPPQHGYSISIRAEAAGACRQLLEKVRLVFFFCALAAPAAKSAYFFLIMQPHQRASLH